MKSLFICPYCITGRTQGVTVCSGNVETAKRSIVSNEIERFFMNGSMKKFSCELL
jgi:hypothetical protein